MIQIVIDANYFSDLAGFYDEVERKFTKDLDWKIGRNLDAFNDVLRGGFGIHEYEEPFLLIWKNSQKSRKELDSLFEEIIDIITTHSQITIKLE